MTIIADPPNGTIEPDEFDTGPVALEGAWYYFEPRPDQPERFDQQTSFVKSQLPGVAFLIGGNGAGTTECCCAKLANFVLREQEPPRRDTPFWIIADSYEQVCEAVWKEKLYGHGHIPNQEIDWERVRWYKPKDGWPFAVPLKPWPGKPGRNWSLQFKSYKQGRRQMQARAIGGFMFSEQFPMEILQEVLRGCREYSFRGAKMCEFTPIDPMLSAQIEEMIEQDKLPRGWGIFRANTECAMEAGHVSKEWFQEFFGLIPEEMKLVRMIGAFASFEGAIYPSFNPAIHFLPEDWEPEVGYQHRRALDWGFGPDNAFCCLWGCRDSVGRWYIYDEYYSTNQAYTIHDHLKAIADRWQWPERNHWYGCTYADPSEPGNLRIASRFNEYHPTYPNFNIQGASNSVLEGIEHVKWLLQFEKSLGGPRLQIVKANCPNLSRQMRTYRWERAAVNGINPRDARPQPLKRDDHACFPAGSLVDTPYGFVPIQRLRAGDVVRTHLGAAIVDVGSQNMGKRDIICVTLSDGRGIKCTAEHPLAKHGGGWVRADESIGIQVDTLCRSENRVRVQETGFSSFRTAVLSGADIQTLRTTPYDAITDEVRGEDKGRSCITGCISRSTSIPAGRFRLGSSCITLTKTTTTTARRISSCRRHQSIQSTIRRTFKRRLPLPPLGTAPRPARNGIKLTRRNRTPGVMSSGNNANIATGLSRRRISRSRHGSAPANAVRTHANSGASTTSQSTAASAPSRSALIVMDRRRLARRNVSPLTVVHVSGPIGSEDVFNLSTADGTYFVNGVLVSNCDALRYLLYSEANKAGIIPEVKRKERDHSRFGIQMDKRK